MIQYAISSFIETRCAELGIDTGALAARLDGRRPKLAERRLRAIMDGFVVSNEHLMARLAITLEVDPSRLLVAVEATLARKEADRLLELEDPETK